MEYNLAAAPRRIATQLNSTPRIAPADYPTNGTSQMSNPTFTMSADARLLLQTLAQVEVGETISDAALHDAIGTDNYSALRTAFKRLMRDEGMIFGRVRKVGWKRLASSEIVSSGVADVERIRRHANRSVEKQMKADFDGLTEPQKAQFTAQVSVMASVAMMTRTKSLKRVADLAPKGARELPIAATLRMFSSPALNDQAGGEAQPAKKAEG